MTDSSHTFARRAEVLAIPDDLVAAVKTAGVDTLGAFAFAIVPPGQSASDTEVDNFVARLFPAGRRLTLGENTQLKRLSFEAHTALVAQLRAESDPSSDPSSRKVPPSERVARIEAQRARLAGLSLDGPLEVAHCVYDMITGILEADQLKYIPPAKCISRTQEVMNLKPSKELRLDQSGSGITVKDAAPNLEYATGTELEVLEAMTRKSLALDCVGLLDYGIAQKWVTDLFGIMQQTVAPGFSKITLVQLLRIDRMAFNRMAELTRDGIKPTSAGVRLLDSLMSSMRSDSAVMFYMLPVLSPQVPPKRTWD